MATVALFEVVAGSYEEYLLGYLVSEKVKEANIKQSFASHDHSASIRCVASSGQYLASGSSDDRIIVYDLKVRKELSMLTHHESTINCLEFTKDNSYLLSGSADGVLAATKVGSWQVEKKWDKAHKGSAIIDIAIHGSGKMALTLGDDLTLRTWNLVKGRQAYAINLNSKCKDPKSMTSLGWAPDDIHFVISGGKYTEIWSIKSGGLVDCFEHEEKVSSFSWSSQNELFVGYENGQIGIVNTKTKKITIHNAHNSRVRSIKKYKDWIISASSNGEIKVWSLDMNQLAWEDAGCRITCMCIIPTIEIKKEKAAKETEDSVFQTSAKKSKVSVPQVVISKSDSEGEEENSNILLSKNRKKLTEPTKNSNIKNQKQRRIKKQKLVLK